MGWSLNIGSIGYFWFERSGFEQKMFKEVHDLELNREMDFGRGESFWGDGRAVALTNEHIDHALHCMMAFAPLSEAEAEPIFKPYFDGLALIAKSDIFCSFRFDQEATASQILRHLNSIGFLPTVCNNQPPVKLPIVGLPATMT